MTPEEALELAAPKAGRARFDVVALVASADMRDYLCHLLSAQWEVEAWRWRGGAGARAARPPPTSSWPM